MPIRSRQKKPNAEPRQKPNHSHAVVDPMVDPGSPPHRRQARAKADTTRTHHRMVTLAQSSPGRSSTSPLQSKQTATVMLEPDGCPAGFRLGVVYNAAFDDWAALSEGAYLLRSNINDWSDRQLWKAYIQLTQ